MRKVKVKLYRWGELPEKLSEFLLDTKDERDHESLRGEEFLCNGFIYEPCWSEGLEAEDD